MKNILYTSGANLKNIIPQLSCRNKFYPILFFISGLLLSMSALQAQVAPTLIPTGGFEIDGGLKSNTPTVGAGDWILGTGGSFVLNNAGTPVDPVTTGHVLDAYNSTADLTFTASKFNQDPNTWSWSASKASSKDDINNVMYHVANDASNYTWLIVGADRLSTNGTSYIDFEFLQKTLTRNSSGGFTSAGLDGGRTVNDIVLSMEYDNGGSAATFHMYFWKPSGSGYTYVEQTIPAGVAFGMTNSNNEDVPFGAFGNSTYIPYQFVEGAINLTAFFGYVDPCFGISVKSLVVKTKASTATTASLGDFVEPIQVNFNFGTAAISYATILCQIGTADVTFSGVPGGSYSSSPAGLSINSSTGQINLASSTPGSYTITYSFITNGCAKSVTTNVIVDPLPVAPTSASVDRNTVCEQDNGNITLSATGGSGTTLQWFNGSCGGALIGTGNSISIPSPTSTTTYYVHWENSCGNSSCAQVTVIVSSLLTVSATGSAQVSCNNGSDGSITVTATGGTGSYNYSLNGGTAQSSNVFSGLSSGTYTVTVNDTYSCSAVTNSIVIANPPLLTASAVGSAQVSCFNSTDGVITVTAAGGTGAYSYSLNGGAAQSSNVFSGLASGSYNVVVTDAKGCSASLESPIVIANPALLTASANGSAQVSCFNSTDGMITVTAAGGTGAYSYSLNGGATQSSNVFYGLAAGSYVITVLDANSCTAITSSVVIANPALLTASATGSAQVSCNNASDGVITVTAAGGTGAYSYSLNGGAAQSSNVFSGLAAGSYVITVLDANSCTAITSSIVIADPALLTASASGFAQVSCNNASDGMITVTAAGGTGAYSYSLNGGAAQSSNVFSGLASGSYNVVVTDAKGCSASLESPIVIANPALLTASATGSAQVSCNNASDGMITVTAVGGTGTYSYSLNGGAAQSSNVFSDLASGSYNVVVTDAKGCAAYLESPIVITNPALLTASATGSAQVSCFNSTDGVITVTALGGTGAYSYSLNGGAAQSSNVFSDLASGSYNVVVTDAKGCAAYLESPIVITNPALLTASATGSAQVSCFNSTDGVITVTAVGGTGTYSYSLNGGAAQSSNVFSDLASGSYNVVVTDAKGCSASLESPIVIANPPLLTASAVGSAQVSCFNSTDGVITVTAAGGTGAYSYSLNGGAAQSSNVFSGLASGSYNVVVTDAKGCSASLESPIVIANPALLTASATGSAQVSCNNASDGVITVTAVGGTGAYSYSLNGGAAQSSNVFSGLASGSYVVTVLDANGCPASLPEITIVNPAAITFTVAQQATSCSGIALGIVTISAQGGTPPYEYSINGGADFSATNTFDSLKTGVIYIIIKDANNCTTQVLPYTVNEYSPIVATVEIVSGNVCYGSNDAEVQINATGGSSPYNYSLDQNSPSLTNIMSGLSAGDHTVNVYDSNGCKSEVPFTIASQKPINISLLNASDANCVGKKDGMIQIAVEGGIEPYSYSWSNGEGSPLISGLDAGTYTVTVTDNNGCPNEFTREVNAGNLQEQLDISNAFSPNGDGINDLWVIKNLDLYPDNTLTVVNRWGNEVLSVNSYQNNWDGSQLLEGTYFYVLKCKMCDTERTFKGYITIVR